MQLIPSHQVINVLTRAVKDGAGFRGADNTILYVMMEAAQRDRHGHTVHKQVTMGDHSLIVPVNTVTVWLHFNGVETLLTGEIRYPRVLG